VSDAVGGGDLPDLAAAAAAAVGLPVAIVIPALGPPVVSPEKAIPSRQLDMLVRRALAGDPALPAAIPVTIGPKVIGVVAAGEAAIGDAQRAWLEATATAAAVATLMREAEERGLEGSRRALLEALRAGPPADVDTFVSHARRLGFELSAGAAAICARADERSGDLPAEPPALLAELGDGRLYGLVSPDDAGALATALAERKMPVALSAARADPAGLHDALREAELMLELGPPSDGQEQTYRLLVGVLLRDRGELEQLRAETVSTLHAYDSRHDTELVATLREFLVKDGSTTDTAEQMRLHRHTVGYRLARVHEVSGLSPYESDGRERLSLGLKADHILAANERLSKHG
jgi:hypothetical protein